MQNKLKQYRTTNDLSQEDLAVKVAVSRQTINAIEKNRYLPSLPLAMKLARNFEIEVEELFELEDSD